MIVHLLVFIKRIHRQCQCVWLPCDPSSSPLLLRATCCNIDLAYNKKVSNTVCIVPFNSNYNKQSVVPLQFSPLPVHVEITTGNKWSF